MNDFIESMSIFKKYMKEDLYAPFNCCHDEMWFCGSPVENFSDEDIYRLRELGWFWSSDPEGWLSYRYGSC